MTDLTRRAALRAIATTTAAGAAVAGPAAVAMASTDSVPAVPPDHVPQPMARRCLIEGYLIDRDPSKLVIGAAAMVMHANGELAIGTITEWEGKEAWQEKYRWRVAIDEPEEAKQFGYLKVTAIVEAIGVVVEGPEPRGGWDSARRVYDHRLAGAAADDNPAHVGAIGG